MHVNSLCPYNLNNLHPVLREGIKAMKQDRGEFNSEMPADLLCLKRSQETRSLGSGLFRASPKTVLKSQVTVAPRKDYVQSIQVNAYLLCCHGGRKKKKRKVIAVLLQRTLIIYPDINIITWQFMENKNGALERMK